MKAKAMVPIISATMRMMGPNTTNKVGHVFVQNVWAAF
jgi:hypothetical protein